MGNIPKVLSVRRKKKDLVESFEDCKHITPHIMNSIELATCIDNTEDYMYAYATMFVVNKSVYFDKALFIIILVTHRPCMTLIAQ